MKDIELVVKIPEEIRLALINNIQLSLDQQSICDSCIKQAIINGTPLPKGHGILKDVDNIKTAFPCGEYIRTESVRATIDHEETIIEADKESEDKE